MTSVLGAIGRSDRVEPAVVALDDPRALAPELAGAKAAALAAAARRGRLVEIPGAAHMTVHTHPDDVRAVLRQVTGR